MIGTNAIPGMYTTIGSGVANGMLDINYEPSIEYSTKEILFLKHKNNIEGFRDFLMNYVKSYNNSCKNLRESVKDVWPEQEKTLENFLLLK
jgi:hypothetical protein